MRRRRQELEIWLGLGRILMCLRWVGPCLLRRRGLEIAEMKGQLNRTRANLLNTKKRGLMAYWLFFSLSFFLFFFKNVRYDSSYFYDTFRMNVYDGLRRFVLAQRKEFLLSIAPNDGAAILRVMTRNNGCVLRVRRLFFFYPLFDFQNKLLESRGRPGAYS